jgi:hypothetical protein
MGGDSLPGGAAQLANELWDRDLSDLDETWCLVGLVADCL